MADIDELARKHGVSPDAVRVLQEAVRHGGGRMAQFSHPDLGGMGQWSSGGMTQVGDMFNSGLRAKVAALCAELAQQAGRCAAARGPAWRPAALPIGGRTGLGGPRRLGAQNSMRYACFPDSRRVAVEQAGTVTVYDSGEHRISGVSQQQSGTQDLSFSSQLGTVRAADLPVVRS